MDSNAEKGVRIGFYDASVSIRTALDFYGVVYKVS